LTPHPLPLPFKGRGLRRELSRTGRVRGGDLNVKINSAFASNLTSI